MIERKVYGVSGAGCFSEIDAKAPSVSSDTLKEYEWCGSISDGDKCDVSEVDGVYDDAYYAPANRAKNALNDLVGAYAAADAMLKGVGADRNVLGERLNRQMNHAKRVIHALESSGPLTGEQIEEVTGLDHGQAVAAVFYLIVSGTISDDGSFFMLTKATETAQDTPEAAETCMGSTQVAEGGTGQDERIPDPPTFCGLSSDDPIQDAVQKMMDTIPNRDARPKSQGELPELASSSLNALISDYRRVIDEWHQMKLQVDGNKAIWEEVLQLRETNNRLLIDSLAYHALKEKLRGMLDAD